MNKRYLIWYWSNPGGGSRYAYCLARRLAREFGADRVTLSLRTDDGNAALAESEGLRVLRADIVSDRKRPMTTALALARSAGILRDHFRQSGADMALLAMNFAAAAALTATSPKPVVYFAHDPKPHPGDYAPVLQQATQRFIMQRARCVVGLSAYAAKTLTEIISPKKVRMSPLGAVFEPAPMSRAHPGAGPVRLLFVGRLLAYKGLDLLAEALGAIAHRQDWRLTIAGGGPQAREAAALSARFLQVAPIKAGWVADATLINLQRTHDILLAPYSSATQSGTIGEAIALAMPVIATPVGALSEQVGAGGWVAAGADATGYGAALARALHEHGAYAAKSAAALEEARGLWNSDWRWLEQL